MNTPSANSQLHKAITPAQAVTICRDFAAKIEPRGKVWMGLNIDKPNDKAIHVSIYDNWPGGDAKVKFDRDTIEEACEALEPEWASKVGQINTAKTEQLALEIIRITDTKGYCTEADLRCLWSFSSKDITNLGVAACEVANRMAGRGPFSIVKTDTSNGAPAENEAVQS